MSTMDFLAAIATTCLVLIVCRLERIADALERHDPPHPPELPGPPEPK
jgi:hypothetical protein